MGALDGQAGPAHVGYAVVPDLTEDGGAIGGSSDGDLPDIGTISAVYDDAEVIAVRDAVREVADQLNTITGILRAAKLLG